VAGDEVSSHYDPMISKLITRGSTRREAIQNLLAALEEYEISGPVTNIEFLKKVCRSADFMSGKVETGYIEKHRPELFDKTPIEDEVLAQIALSIFLGDASSQLTSLAGFGAGLQSRLFSFVETAKAGEGKDVELQVKVQQRTENCFDVEVNRKTFENVECSWKSDSNIITSFFPHTRLDTTVIRDEDSITAFQRGKGYRLKTATPKWMEKALGIKDVANSVLAPMPCKVLRVEVEEGDEVKQDQPLVVIESMKMETVIRSPHDGKIAKVVHKKGVS
jgi:3-methylcrotonyl-CoA carboxylase alpha subunit